MSRIRIVAVDDDRRILRILKQVCERVGFEVHSVQDANFFESSFRTFEPELVFLDLNMRNIDGVELLRHMAEERPGTTVVVIGGVNPRMLSAARTLGISLGLNMLEPISKPLMVADIRQRLKQFSQQPALQLPNPHHIQNISDALSNVKVDLSYQPMVRLKTRQVICADVQTRIRHPQQESLSHSQFIPMAQKHNQLEPLTLTVIHKALQDLSSWDAASDDFQVAIHVSQDLLFDPGFASRIRELLHNTDTRPQRLVFEIVEGREINDRLILADSLTQLSELGISLSLSKFGSNITNITQIYDFPYQTLKLDKQFAQHAHKDENAVAMIRSSLDLARSVGLAVAVEGIQTEETLHWLEQLGCELGQGRCICPPMPSAEFSRWLANIEQRHYQLPSQTPSSTPTCPKLVACGA